MRNLINFLTSEFRIAPDKITTHMFFDRLLGIEVHCPMEKVAKIVTFFPTSVVEKDRHGEFGVLIEGDACLNLFSN
jgi:hypothetical protein